jgi:hypothetical protein
MSRVLALGVALGVVLFVVLWPVSKPSVKPPPSVTSGRVQIAVPELDRELLATVADATPEQRMMIEPEALSHLLEKSLSVVPTVAEALGRPEQPQAPSILAAAPERFRGSWQWYRGRLAYVSPGKSGHPVEGYRIFEGFLELEGTEGPGSVVMFRASRLGKDVRVGDWVRIEGFFLKLRDSLVLPEAQRAPLLVGPEIVKDFEPWPRVESLQPDMFAGLADGIFAKGEGRRARFEIVDEQDARDDLESSQSEPLWYLAAHALQFRGGPTDTLLDWREVPAFVKPDQYRALAFGNDVPRGTRFRLLGTFVMSRWFAAPPNPVGIAYWSTVWVQSADLGGKLIPIWVPRKIENIEFGATLEVRAYWFKRLLYEARAEGGSLALTPVFVAADLDRFVQLPESSAAIAVKYGFAALVAGVVVLFYLMARGDRQRTELHEAALVERRRKRRQVTSRLTAESST